MPILYGAVAYREDQLTIFESEIQSWDLTRTYEHPIACPAGCVENIYRLILEINASDETAQEFVEMIHKAMQHECPQHSPRIRLNEPHAAN